MVSAASLSVLSFERSRHCPLHFLSWGPRIRRVRPYKAPGPLPASIGRQSSLRLHQPRPGALGSAPPLPPGAPGPAPALLPGALGPAPPVRRLLSALPPPRLPQNRPIPLVMCRPKGTGPDFRRVVAPLRRH